MRLVDANTEKEKIKREIKIYEEKLTRIEGHAKQGMNNSIHDWAKEMENVKKNILECKVELRFIDSFDTVDILRI